MASKKRDRYPASIRLEALRHHFSHHIATNLGLGKRTGTPVAQVRGGRSQAGGCQTQKRLARTAISSVRNYLRQRVEDASAISATSSTRSDSEPQGITSHLDTSSFSSRAAPIITNKFPRATTATLHPYEIATPTPSQGATAVVTPTWGPTETKAGHDRDTWTVCRALRDTSN
jgi:hypothetical protein